MIENGGNVGGETSGLARTFELIAQLSHSARVFVERSFGSSKRFQEKLAEEGARVSVDPFGGIDLSSMTDVEIASFMQACIRVKAKEQGIDPDEAMARNIDWLMAEHFDIEIDLAHQLALEHLKGGISGEEEARDFITRHRNQERSSGQQAQSYCEGEGEA